SASKRAACCQTSTKTSCRTSSACDSSRRMRRMSPKTRGETSSYRTSKASWSPAAMRWMSTSGSVGAGSSAVLAQGNLMDASLACRAACRKHGLSPAGTCRAPAGHRGDPGKGSTAGSGDRNRRSPLDAALAALLLGRRHQHLVDEVDGGVGRLHTATDDRGIVDLQVVAAAGDLDLVALDRRHLTGDHVVGQDLAEHVGVFDDRVEVLLGDRGEGVVDRGKDGELVAV